MEEILVQDLEPEIKKILLVGPSGSGKTNFLRTVPDYMKPVYVCSFDKGVSTLSGATGIKAGVFRDKDRNAPQAYKEFLMKLGLLEGGEKFKWPTGREEEYKTMALDPITFLSRYLFDDIQRLNNNVDKKAGYTEWQLVKSRMIDILDRLVNTNKYIICTALIENERDELTGQLWHLANLEGSIRHEIEAWFDAVFYMNVDKDLSGNTKYSMLLVGSPRHKAKLRMPADFRKYIKAIEEPDLGKLMEKVQRAKREVKK